MRQTHKDYGTDFFLIPINFELYYCFNVPSKVHSSKINYFIWHIPLCKLEQYLQGFSTHKRNNYARTETTEIHVMTCQDLNTLERADKSSVLWVYFSQTKSQAVFAYSMGAMCSKWGNRDWSLEMHAKIKNTPSGKVTEVLQNRSGNFMPQPNTWKWKLPTNLRGLSDKGFLLAAKVALPSSPETLLFPREPCLCSSLKCTANKD